MCEPATIALAVASAASATAGIVQQNRSATQQRRSAERSGEFARVGAQNRQQEEQIALRAKQFDRRQKANRERGRIRVASANQGLVGTGASRQQAVANVNTAIDLGRIATNFDFVETAGRTNLEAIGLQTSAAVDRANAAMVNPFVGALQVGLSGIQGAVVGSQISGTPLFPSRRTPALQSVRVTSGRDIELGPGAALLNN